MIIVSPADHRFRRCFKLVNFNQRTLRVTTDFFWSNPEEIGAVTWVNVVAGISEPIPHYSLFLVNLVTNYRPNLCHFGANDFLNLKVQKKCDFVLVTLLKMPEKGPHYSQSSRENATPSSGTSPIAGHY